MVKSDTAVVAVIVLLCGKVRPPAGGEMNAECGGSPDERLRGQNVGGDGGLRISGRSAGAYTRPLLGST